MKLLRRDAARSADSDRAVEPQAKPPPGKTLLKLWRRKSWNQFLAQFQVMLDGIELGLIRNGEKAEFIIDPGQHELRLLAGPHPLTPGPLGHLGASRPVQFSGEEGQVVEFVCGPGPMARLPLARVPDPERTPDLILKPKPPRVTRRTWNTYD